MFCKYCGKKIEDNTKFCPYCGVGLSTSDTDNFKETSADSSKEIETNMDDAENEQVQSNIENVKETDKTAKAVLLVLSFIIGMVLSFITFLLIRHSTLTGIALIVVPSIGFGLLAYAIILKLSGNGGISLLSAIIIGFVGMWKFGDIAGSWVEAVEMADTGFGVFVRLFPVGLIWTFIIYCIANGADNNNNSQK